MAGLSVCDYLAEAEEKRKIAIKELRAQRKEQTHIKKIQKNDEAKAAAIMAKTERIQQDANRKRIDAERKEKLKKEELARRAAQSENDRRAAQIERDRRAQAILIPEFIQPIVTISKTKEQKKQNRIINRQNHIIAAERKAKAAAENKALDDSLVAAENESEETVAKLTEIMPVTDKIVSQIKNIPQFMKLMDENNEDMQTFFPSLFSTTSTKTVLKCLKGIDLENLNPIEFLTIANSVNKEIKYKANSLCNNTKFVSIWTLLDKYYKTEDNHVQISKELCSALKEFKPQDVLQVSELVKRLVNNRITSIMLKQNKGDLSMCDNTFNSLLGSIKLSEGEYSFIMAVAHKCVSVHSKNNSEPFKTANTMVTEIMRKRQHYIKTKADIAALEVEISSLQSKINEFGTPLLNNAHSSLIQYIQAILVCYHTKYSFVLESFETTGVFPQIVKDLAIKYSFWNSRLTTLSVKEYTFGVSITDVKKFEPALKSNSKNNGLSMCTTESPCPESDRLQMKSRIINFLMNLHEEKIRESAFNMYSRMLSLDCSFEKDIANADKLCSDESISDIYRKTDYEIQLALYKTLDEIMHQLYNDSHVANLKDFEAKNTMLVTLKGSISYAIVSEEFKLGKSGIQQEMINYAVKIAQELTPNGKTVDSLQKFGILLNAAKTDAELAIKYEQSRIYSELCKYFAERGNDQAVAFSKSWNNKVIACREGRNCKFICEISKVLREYNVENFFDLPLVKQVALRNMCMFFHVGIDSMNINPEFAHNYRLFNMLKSEEASDIKDFLPLIWEILCEKMIEHAHTVQTIYRKIELGNSVEKGSGKIMDYPNIYVGDNEHRMIELLIQQKSLTMDKSPVLVYTNDNFKILLQMYYGVIMCGIETSSIFEVEYKNVNMTKFMLAFAYLTKSCKRSMSQMATNHREYVNQLVMQDILSSNPKIVKNPNLMNVCLSGCPNNMSCSGLGYQCLHGSHEETIIIDVASRNPVEIVEDPEIAELKRTFAVETGSTPEQQLESCDMLRNANKQEYYRLSKELFNTILEISSITGRDIPVNITNFKAAIGRVNSRIGNIRSLIQKHTLDIVSLESSIKTKEEDKIKIAQLTKSLALCSDIEEHAMIESTIQKLKQSSIINMSDYHRVSDLRSEITTLQMKLMYELVNANTQKESLEVIESVSESSDVKRLLNQALDLVVERNKIDKILEDSYRNYIRLYKKVHGKYPSQYGLTELCNITDNINMCYLTKRYNAFQQNYRIELQARMEAEYQQTDIINPNQDWLTNVQALSKDQIARAHEIATQKHIEQLEIERAERDAVFQRIRAEKREREFAERERRNKLAKMAADAVASGQFPNEAAFYADNARKEEESRLARIAANKAAEQAKREAEAKRFQSERDARELEKKTREEAERIYNLKENYEARIARWEAALAHQRAIEDAMRNTATDSIKPQQRKYSSKHEKKLARERDRENITEQVEKISVKHDNTEARLMRAAYELRLELNKQIGVSIPAFMKKIRDSGFNSIDLPENISKSTLITFLENYFQDAIEFRALQVENIDLLNELDTQYGTGDKAQTGSKYQDLYKEFASSIADINNRLDDFGSIRINVNATIKELRRFKTMMSIGEGFINISDATGKTIEPFMQIQNSLSRIIEAISSECEVFVKRISQIKATIHSNEEKMRHFKINIRNKAHEKYVDYCADIVVKNYMTSSLDQQVQMMITCMQFAHYKELQMVMEKMASVNKTGVLTVLCKLFKESESDMTLETFYNKWMGIPTVIVPPVIEPVITNEVKTTRFTIIQDGNNGSLKKSGYFYVNLGFTTNTEAKAFVKSSGLNSKFGCRMGFKDGVIVVEVFAWQSNYDRFLQNALIKAGLMTEEERDTPVYNGMNA